MALPPAPGRPLAHALNGSLSILLEEALKPFRDESTELVRALEALQEREDERERWLMARAAMSSRPAPLRSVLENKIYIIFSGQSMAVDNDSFALV
jgi:hypothetical protein